MRISKYIKVLGKVTIFLSLLFGLFIVFPIETHARTIDMTWNTGAADFEIWTSSTLSWDNGTLLCSASLTDDNASTVSCDSGTTSNNTDYRVQVELDNAGDTAADWKSTGEYVVMYNVHSWAGSGATEGTCGYNDLGTDDAGPPACSLAFVDEDTDGASDDLRLSNPNAAGNNHVQIAGSGSQGFMYLITTGTVATSSESYWQTTDADDPEDSSKITISTAAVTSFTQSNYRWYVDSDTEDVTDPWGNPDIAQNTAITLTPPSNDPPDSTQELRLRVNFTVNGAALSASSQQFDLQFRTGTDTDCSTGTWADVGAVAASAFQFASSSVTDGTTLTASKLSSDVLQVYAKSNPTATNPNSATVGQTIEYDFHIIGSGSDFASATQYLFRAVEADGTVFDGYTNCAVLQSEPGPGDLLRHGNVFSGGDEQGFFWAD